MVSCYILNLFKVPLYGETVEDAIRDLLDVDVSVKEDCLHLGWICLIKIAMQWNALASTILSYLILTIELFN